MSLTEPVRYTSRTITVEVRAVSEKQSDSNDVVVVSDVSNVFAAKSFGDDRCDTAGSLGEFNGMSSQSHVSHCRVLPLGEFAVTIPEPHATLQGVVFYPPY